MANKVKSATFGVDICINSILLEKLALANGYTRAIVLQLPWVVYCQEKPVVVQQ